MATIDVLDAAGDTQTIAKVAATGQAAMADSLPVAIASDQSLPLPTGAATEATLDDVKTAVEALAAGDPPTQTTLATLATEATLAAQSAKLPAALGSAADSGSLSVAQSTEGKAAIGALTETAPASDTASSGLNGRLQRIAQRITSLIALLPATLGPKAGASSLSVVEATPTTVTIVSLQTNATGATYTAFASQACEQLDIVNTQSGAVDLEVRRGGSGYTIIVPGGSSRMFIGLANASDLQVRRADQSNTQITFTGEAVKA
jgi:hypothetical protein